MDVCRMKKKIMFAVSRLTGGGAERVVSLWANGLSIMNYKVTILVAYRTENEYEINPKVNIETIASSVNEYLNLGLLKKLHLIRKIIKANEIECVIPFLPAMQILVMLAAQGTKCKRIDTIRINPWKMNSVTSKIGKMLWKLCFKTADAIIIQTEEQELFFDDKIKKKCCVIPNAIGDFYLNYNNKREMFSVEKCIAVGRICEQKNYKLLIEGFADIVKKYPNAKIDIYGTGESDYCNSINQLILLNNMENNIVLKGRVENMERVYGNYDYFLMTSNYEGLPNALIESMASGLICISTDCKTGPRDLISQGKTGFLISVGDKNNFVDTVNKAFAIDQNELKKISINARKDILNKCSSQNTFSKLCSLIDEI